MTSPSLAVRALALPVSLALVAAAQGLLATRPDQQIGWWLLLAAALGAAAWQAGFTITDWTQSQGRQWGLAPQRWRRITGGLVTLFGAALWFDATQQLSADWGANFDRAWLTWFVATPVMSLGLRLLQAPLSPARNRLSRWEWAVLVVAFAVAAAFRLANFDNFPPPDAVSQVEELQAGQFGTRFLTGDRGRWEFMSQAAIAGLGIWIGGPTLRSVREVFAVVNLLKIIPAYFWFRALSGPAGAVVGTALLAVSGWDSIINRIPGHPDGLITMCCLALLAGPAVRGLWAVYPWVGLLAGYSTITYIAFRPLVGLALAGVVVANLARISNRNGANLLRVVAPTLLVASLVAGIFIPLTHRLENQFTHEYLNGWNRARAQEDYYGPRDSWSSILSKRWERTAQAVGLFYTQGDSNPVRNVNSRPQVDPVTGSLMLFGIGYCALMCLRGFYGLVVGAFGVTFVGTVIATGNFDPLRLQATIQYVYALAAIGAGGLVATAQRSFGRAGRGALLALLAAGVLGSAYWNGQLVWDLWTSPVTRQHYRSDLAYLSVWLRANTVGKQVIGLIPSNANVVFQENDASWLLGGAVRGTAAWDVHETLRKLSELQGDAVLLLCTPTMLRDGAQYFEYILPGLQFEFRGEETRSPTKIAYSSIATPAIAADSPLLRDGACAGARARFELRDEHEKVIESFTMTVPFIDTMTWPGAVREAAFRHEQAARWIDAVWEGDFTITEPGSYVFLPEFYEGTVTVTIDETRIAGGNQVPVALSVGPHHFSMKGRFNALMIEPTARLSWRREGGDEEKFNLVPFYRLAAADPRCSAAAPNGRAPQAAGSGG
ncbi:MAG: hypothetical protein HY699_19860 [Deltaproteobacteria bacterium]|nr:hypothetical protein [Deltaproteobacteria bacterium]